MLADSRVKVHPEGRPGRVVADAEPDTDVAVNESPEDTDPDTDDPELNNDRLIEGAPDAALLTGCSLPMGPEGLNVSEPPAPEPPLEGLPVPVAPGACADPVAEAELPLPLPLPLLLPPPAEMLLAPIVAVPDPEAGTGVAVAVTVLSEPAPEDEPEFTVV